MLVALLLIATNGPSSDDPQRPADSEGAPPDPMACARDLAGLCGTAVSVEHGAAPGDEQTAGSRIEFRLVDPHGRPLTPEDVAEAIYGYAQVDDAEVGGYYHRNRINEQHGAARALAFDVRTSLEAVVVRRGEPTDAPTCPGQTDDGVYRLDVSPDWSGVVGLQGRGAWIASRIARAGESVDVTVDIATIRRELGTLRLDVIDAATGDPVPKIMMYVRRLGSDLSARCNFTYGAEDDTVGTTFAFDNLPTGHYEIQAGEVWPSREGVPTRTGATRAVVAAGRASHVSIRLRPAGQILLRLVDPDGKPTSPTRTIVAYRDDRDQAYDLGTNRHGLASDDPEAVHLGGAPPGRGFVLFEGQAQPVWIESGQTTELVMRLAPTRDVELRWPAPRVDRKGREVEFSHLAVLTREGTTLSEEPVYDVEVEEELAFLQLPAGRYTARLTCCDGRTLEREIMVPAWVSDNEDEDEEEEEDTLVIRLR